MKQLLEALQFYRNKGRAGDPNGKFTFNQLFDIVEIAVALEEDDDSVENLLGGTMKNRILTMLQTLRSINYDKEQLHLEYDSLLQEFILNYNPALIELMRELISVKKDFYYA